MPKAPNSPSNNPRPRHNPLTEDYFPSAPPKLKPPKRRKLSPTADDPAPTNYIDSKSSQRILRIGQDLLEEEDDTTKPSAAFEPTSRLPPEPVPDEPTWPDEDSAWGDDSDVVVDEAELHPADRAIFDRFHPSAAAPDPSSITLDEPTSPNPADSPSAEDGESTNLTSLILSKIAEHEATTTTTTTTADRPTRSLSPAPPEIPPAAQKVYTQIGTLLSTYRSGPLPKPFKLLPTLPPAQLSLLLDLTRPESWSPNAHLPAVRLFISQKPQVATPYLQTILLPKVRDEIQQTKKLNTHLYAALRKALYKPAAFFKGIVFPLLEDECSAREATIVASAVARTTVPVLHSAAALLRCVDIAAERFTLAQADGGGGGTNIFIKMFVEKKYALPYKVIDALVFHFVRFKALKNTGEYVQLPVLWHQTLLAFAQSYRNDITEDQREALLDVVSAVGHREIGPEVRRELLAGRGRGTVVEDEVVDDTMMGED